ncbi:MAG: lysylphosphatidylglycerol synthase transmembrane domain-containing protein, partial [Clostridia bacterium]
TDSVTAVDDTASESIANSAKANKTDEQKLTTKSHKVVFEQFTADEEQAKIDSASKMAESLTNTKSKKNIFSILFLLASIVIIVILAIVEFSGDNNEYSFADVMSMWGRNWKYLVLAVAVLGAMLLLDGLRNAILLKGATGQWKYKLMLKTSILGRYFDSITPAAFGGQPYQVYYLHKNKVSAGVSTSLPIVSFFMQQLAFLVLAITAFIVRPNAVDTVWLKVVAYVGAFFMVAIPISIIVFAFFPVFTKKIVHGCIKFLSKIKLIKNKEATQQKFDNYAEDYCRSIKTLGGHVKTLILTFIVSILSQLACFSIAYFVVRACGSNDSYIDVVSKMLYVVSAVALIPTPGTSGASEATFYLVFSSLKGGFLFYGMVLWRVISFYLPIVIGIGVYANNTLKEKRYIKNGIIRTRGEVDDAITDNKEKDNLPSDKSNSSNKI